MKRFLKTKEYGVVDTSDLPIRVLEDKEGYYELVVSKDVKGNKLLIEQGGTGAFDWGGRTLTVLEESDEEINESN